MSTISPSLRYTLARKFMRNASFYNNEVIPFLKSTPRFAVQAYCLRDNKELYEAMVPPQQQQQQQNLTSSNDSVDTPPTSSSNVVYPKLEDILLNKSNNNTSSVMLPAAMQGLRQLSMWRQRMEQTTQQAFAKVDYEFEVGEVVQHAELNHVGVVAAKLPICFESDDWINENLGSLTDYRLTCPWYLILVARHDPLPYDFVRYGSQLTHIKGPCEPIGCHRMLPMFFSGFCRETGRYVPREQHINAAVMEAMGKRSNTGNNNGGGRADVVVPSFSDSEFMVDENSCSSSSCTSSSSAPPAFTAPPKQYQLLVEKKRQQQQQQHASYSFSSASSSAASSSSSTSKQQRNDVIASATPSSGSAAAPPRPNPRLVRRMKSVAQRTARRATEGKKMKAISSTATGGNGKARGGRSARRKASLS